MPAERFFQCCTVTNIHLQLKEFGGFDLSLRKSLIECKVSSFADSHLSTLSTWMALVIPIVMDGANAICDYVD